MIEDENQSSLRPVIVFARYFEPAFRAGGPVRTLSALTDQANRQFDVRVITTNRDLRVSQPLAVESNEWVERKTASVYYADSTNPLRFIAALNSAREICPRIIYVNSFFDFKFALLPILLSRFGFFGEAKLLVAPRGEFGAGALGLKSTPKRVFLAMFNFLQIAGGAIWHASTDLEAQDIKKSIPKAKKVVVKEDETHLPRRSTQPLLSSSSTLRAIFLSRISPMKGLDLLLESLEMVHISLVLDVYGPVDDDEFLQKCLALTDLLDNSNLTVTFRGEVPSEAVRDTLAHYDVMILPTRGENFGHIIAESLSVSVPVMCSPHTPWTETLVSGGGVVVFQDSPASWAKAVTQFATLDVREKNALKVKSGAAYNLWAKRRDQTSLFEMVDD